MFCAFGKAYELKVHFFLTDWVSQPEQPGAHVRYLTYVKS